KQAVVMILAINGAEFARRQEALREFVLDRDRTGLPERYRVYLVLYRGPFARMVGLAGSLDARSGRQDMLTEVAHPPFAVVLTVDSEPGLLLGGDITGFADVPYGE